jgi:hypothetical protein
MKKYTYQKKFPRNLGVSTHNQGFSLLKKKYGRELKTPVLVECDEQPVLLQVVEAASCRRRHETKHLLKTQYLR